MSLRLPSYRKIRRKLASRFPGDGVILCLHGVAPASELAGRVRPVPSMEVSTEFLGRALDRLGDEGYRFVSLDDVVDEIEGRRGDGPFACVTFDDGYTNNLTHAWPLLRARGVPMALFVLTGFPDGEVVHWGGALEAWLADAAEVKVDGRSLPAGTAAEKAAVYDVVSGRLRAMDTREHAGYLAALGAPTQGLTLSWDELRHLAREGVTLGGHTATHRKLSGLDEAEAAAEIQRSLDRIREETGAPARHFAYPFGDHGRRERRLVERLGLRGVCTTRAGHVRLRRSDPLSLPRVGLVEGDLESVT